MEKQNIVQFIFDNRDYFEDFITRSTYHSNSIEGNTLSYAETYAIIFNDNSIKISAEPREIHEAINHKYALNYVMNNVESDLSESIIKKIGMIINKNILEISGFRTCQVFIRGAEHIPPAPNQIQQAMMYLIYNYNHTEYRDIYEKIAAFHIEFERIHPLQDGNGRTGRLLINYELLKQNLPPVVIEKENRAEYFSLISDYDIQGLAGLLKKENDKEKDRIAAFGYPKDEIINDNSEFSEEDDNIGDCENYIKSTL